MKIHKRKKNSRIRGARTVGWGFRQKHKGHGNKGGFGKAGTGKKADHKKQSTEMSVKGKYFGKQGATSRGTARDKRKGINLYDIKNNLFVKDGQKIELAKYKILGTGDGFKAEIVALGASKLAIQKMEKAGGKIVLSVRKEEVKQYAVKEKVEKKIEKEKTEGKE